MLYITFVLHLAETEYAIGNFVKQAVTKAHNFPYLCKFRECVPVVPQLFSGAVNHLM